MSRRRDITETPPQSPGPFGTPESLRPVFGPGSPLPSGGGEIRTQTSGASPLNINSAQIHTEQLAGSQVGYSGGYQNAPPSAVGETYTTQKHIHINSKHINFRDNKADFEVGLITPIRNARRMCLRSFSTPNTGHNFVEGANHFRWVEIQRHGTTGAVLAKGFSISIPSGYFTGAQFASAFNAQVNALTNHPFNAEGAPILSLSYSSATYHLTFNARVPTTGAVQNKWIVLLRDDNQTDDFHRVGFEANQTLSYPSGAFRDGEGVLLTPEGDLQAYASAIANDASYVDPTERLQRMNTSGISIYGALESLIENRMGFYITTNLSINDVYETHRRLGKNLAEQTNILSWVINDTSRYSYLHYEPNNKQYHTLHQDSINSIKLTIRDEYGRVLEASELRDFVLTLEFEVEETTPYSKDFLQRRYADAYTSAHPTRVR